MPLNLFLLFHKCGNNYVANAHRIFNKLEPDRQDFRYVEILPREAKDIGTYEDGQTCINIRCRNFGYQQMEAENLISPPNIRHLVFTRHPASFVLSATAYHVRGNEAWAREKPQDKLDGLTLTGALKAAKTEGERQIITMRLFYWLYNAQSSLATLLNSERAMQVRCEDIFSTADPQYYQDVANFLGLGGSLNFVEALKNASPAFKEKLSPHSTGEFSKKEPYNYLEGEAREFYDEHFKEFEKTLGY